MKRNGKATFLMALLALATAKGAAIEREGEILFEPELFAVFGQYGVENVLRYRLDENGDYVEDRTMTSTDFRQGPAYGVLARYLRPGVKIVFEDEDLKPREGFGAGRMIGFIMSNGNFVRLDQMFSEEVIQQYFPRLWTKIQAEQRASR